MSWTARIILGLAIAAGGGAAMACEREAPCGSGRYEAPPHSHRAWREPYGLRQDPPACLQGCGGEITLPSSFFAGGGGVGPIPAGPDYGVYVIVRGGGFGGTRAFAASSASAVATSRVSVSVSGGRRSGGCCH
ncbi:MAG: hypothetical protein ACK4YQ_03625 [Phenylobacterium sp.]|uniref:hypothetical protein n=1 Tax=Phenylobacterium sp. TaxID=1871053 RepID=UPI0039192EDF